MQYSMMEVLKLTIVSMGIVFTILLGIMCLMILVSKIFSENEETVKPETLEKTPVPVNLTTHELFENDPLAKAAALTALAEASGNHDGKRFQIEKIERIK